MLEKILESPLDYKKIKPVNPKGNQPWTFIGRTDAEAPILWPPDAKSQLIGIRPWCWERLRAGGEGGTTEDEMVGWHHQLTGHEFEQAPGVGDGQGSLMSCSPQGCKESDMTEWLNWTDISCRLKFRGVSPSLWKLISKKEEPPSGISPLWGKIAALQSTDDNFMGKKCG